MIAFSVKIMPGLFKKCLVIVAPAHGLAWSLHMRHLQCFLYPIQSCFRTQSTVLGIMYNSTSLWRVDPAFHSVLPQCFFSMDINTLFLCTSMTEMAFLLFLYFFGFFSTLHCCQIRAYCFPPPSIFPLKMNVACGELASEMHIVIWVFFAYTPPFCTKYFTTHFNTQLVFSSIYLVITWWIS